ncbi:MAG: response regulator [Reyranella sp.]|nr:response regulator [Reyranella sp.]
MQLLLIEDDDDLRSEIRDYLMRRRHDVIALGSIGEARELLGLPPPTAQPFDAVVCDINLKDGDGIDLYVEFGSRRPACRWILMSGDPDTQRVVEERRRHPALPPYAMVEKPVPLRRLTELLTGGGGA